MQQGRTYLFLADGQHIAPDLALLNARNVGRAHSAYQAPQVEGVLYTVDAEPLAATRRALAGMRWRRVRVLPDVERKSTGLGSRTRRASEAWTLNAPADPGH